MAEVLDVFPGDPNRRGAFAFLTDGRIYRLRRGEDFPADMKFISLRGRFSYVAARHGMKQHTKQESNDVIIVQLYKP